MQHRSRVEPLWVRWDAKVSFCASGACPNVGMCKCYNLILLSILDLNRPPRRLNCCQEELLTCNTFADFIPQYLSWLRFIYSYTTTAAWFCLAQPACFDPHLNTLTSDSPAGALLDWFPVFPLCKLHSPACDCLFEGFWGQHCFIFHYLIALQHMHGFNMHIRGKRLWHVPNHKERKKNETQVQLHSQRSAWSWD